MNVWLSVMCYAVGGGVTLAVLIALLRSARPVRQLVTSGVQGLCALAAVNVAGSFTGISLGLNWLTGIGCAVLGIPGVVSIMVARLLFHCV